MKRSNYSGPAAVAFLTALAFGSAPDALAQSQKVSYERAWALCKAQIDKTVFGEQQTVRATVGAGCMRKYGYRLKK